MGGEPEKHRITKARYIGVSQRQGQEGELITISKTTEVKKCKERRYV